MVENRLIALIDMDCFYVQVEQRLQPHLYDKPVAVVQHSSAYYKGGGILAVSYEARKFGIKRGMFGEEAKEKCPELTLCYVPSGEHVDKADITRYRDASAEVFKVLHEFDARLVVERASVDEAYLDLSELVDYIINSIDCPKKYSKADIVSLFPTTHVAGEADVNTSDSPDWHYDRVQTLQVFISSACVHNDYKMRLLIAADLVEQIRARIKENTSFNCSAGIGSSKMIAKLVCSRHKPGQQTVIANDAIPCVFNFTVISSVRNLGGKLGRALMQEFDIKTMGELAAISPRKLSEKFPAQATWIHKIARGIDDELVVSRDKQSSVAVSKNFPGPTALKTTDDMKFWLDGLVKELVKRLVDDQLKNNRTALTLHIGCTTNVHVTRSISINGYDPQSMLKDVWSTFRQFNSISNAKEWPPVHNITLSASRFRDGLDCRSQQITEWIAKVANEKSFTDPSQNSTVTLKRPSPKKVQKHTVDGNYDDDNDIEIISSKIVKKPPKDTSKPNIKPTITRGKKRTKGGSRASLDKKISDFFPKY